MQKYLRSILVCSGYSLTFLIMLIEGLSFASDIEDRNLGLPLAIVDVENVPTAKQVALGKMLFFDKRLSADGSISCASCHQPERAFSDGKPLAVGVGGRIGTRNTPSIINAAFNTSQFWDGRRDSLEGQALDPLFNPSEHGLKDYDYLIKFLQNDPHYVSAFNEAFGVPANEIQIKQVSQAIASFERAELISGNSPFDRYFYKDEKSQLAPGAVRGLALFQGAAKCATCHTIGAHDALFTDNQFHSLSIGLKRIESRLPEITKRLVQIRKPGGNLDQAVLSQEDIAELGRFSVTLNPADIGKFRTPSLRNVALTAPYMHDGSVATLREAVELEIYYRSAEEGRPLILTPIEKADLVEFLSSLSSPLLVVK